MCLNRGRLHPDAGGTDQVSQNRGYFTIPEVGDQVMVGFVHNHPDRPFVKVMGMLDLEMEPTIT